MLLTRSSPHFYAYILQCGNFLLHRLSGRYDGFPRDFWNTKDWPSPLGLSLGLLAVAVGQVFMLGYFVLRRGDGNVKLVAIQKQGITPYSILAP